MAPSRILNRHLLHLRPLCIVPVTRLPIVIKTERHHGDHLHLWTTGAVDLRETNRHRTDRAEGDAVARNLRQYDRTDDPALVTGIKIETEIEIGHESILEGTDQDRDHERDRDLGTEDVVAAVIEVGTDTDTGRAGDIIEHLPTNRMHLKIMQKQWHRNLLFLHSLMLSRMMAVSWKCSKKCRNKCNLHRNLQPLR